MANRKNTYNPALDHDANGKNGGSVSAEEARKRLEAEVAADRDAPTAAENHAAAVQAQRDGDPAQIDAVHNAFDNAPLEDKVEAGVTDTAGRPMVTPTDFVEEGDPRAVDGAATDPKNEPNDGIPQFPGENPALTPQRESEEERHKREGNPRPQVMTIPIPQPDPQARSNADILADPNVVQPTDPDLLAPADGKPTPHWRG